MMIDVTDQGSILTPSDQQSVSGVRVLQVSGPYILGGIDSQGFEHLGTDSNQVDSYFVLDTRTGKMTPLREYDALKAAALQLGIQTNLEPIETVYSRYRFSWFDVFAGLLSFVPPLIGFLLLVWWVVRLRRTRLFMSQ